MPLNKETKLYIYIYIYIYEEMVDFGESDKMLKISGNTDNEFHDVSLFCFQLRTK